MQYYHRTVWNKVKEALNIMPAVFLNGPRQVGKSTMMEQIAKKYMGADYVTFDDISTFASASSDPEGFLRSFKKPVIIDEVQKVPGICSSLKLLIDEYRQKDKASANGKFLLTSSVNIMAVPKLSEALVGRVAIISLYPLLIGEVLLKEWRPVINGWFDQNIVFQKGEEELFFDKIIHLASFPETVGMNAHDRDVWFSSYINTLLQRDVRDLAKIEKLSALPNMVKMLAARAGSLLNNASFAKDTGLGAMTYERYRVLLEQLFLITVVKPWYRNINLRLVRTPKVFFTDTALLCHQLGVNPMTLKRNNPLLFGHVLENFVFSELQKQLNLLSDDYSLHFFCVHGNKEEEVNFVIERKNGSLIGIEVKSYYSVNSSDFKTLKKLRKCVGKDFIRGIVLYCGKDTLLFGEDMVAMPINQLWNFNMETSFSKAVQ